MPIFVAWLVGIGLTTVWMFLSVLVLGLLSLKGIFKARAINSETVILVGGAVIHLITQLKAYMFALSQIKKVEEHTRPKEKKQRSAKEEYFLNNLGVRLKVGRRDQDGDQIQE